MIFNILMILLGLSTTVYSFFEIQVYGSLYFARNYHCIERLREKTKVTDLVSCMHNLAKCSFGIALTVVGLKRWIPEDNLHIVETLVIISIGLLMLDMLVMEGATRLHGLKGLRSEIQQKWKGEKVFGPEHDHEVNLYRGLLRLTQQYPKHIIIMGVCMILLLVFFL